MHRSTISFFVLLALTATAYRLPANGGTESQRYAAVSNELGYRLQRTQSYQSGNQLISPYGISKVLSVLYEGTRGRTQQQLSRLGYGALERQGIEICQSYQQLRRYFQRGSGGSQLEEATALLYPSSYSVSPQYQQVLKSSYQCLVQQQVSYRQGSESTLQEVNRWIQEETRGKISQIVDEIDTSSGFALLNGVYYQGSLQSQSGQDQIQQGSFYNEGETSPQSALYYQTQSRYPYYQDEQLQAVQLPYQDEEYSLLVLLPSQQSGIRQIQQQVSSRAIQRLIRTSQETQVRVSIPQLKLDHSHQLQGDIQSLGVTSVFETGADFSGISSSGSGYISQITQRAVFELGEHGIQQQGQFGLGHRSQYGGRQQNQYGAGQEYKYQLEEEDEYRAGQEGQYGAGEQGQYGAEYRVGQESRYGYVAGLGQDRYRAGQDQYRQEHGAGQEDEYRAELGQYGSEQQDQYGQRYRAERAGQYGARLGQYEPEQQDQYGQQYGAGQGGQYRIKQHDYYGFEQQGHYGVSQGQYETGQGQQYGYGIGLRDQNGARQENEYDYYSSSQGREGEVEFRANRPFLFYVIHKSTGLNVLAGRISQL